MKKLEQISKEEWAELVIHIEEKVYGKLKYPHIPLGIQSYKDEVITSLRNIRNGTNKDYRPHRLAPVLTIEFLPWFVIKWLQEHEFDI